MAGVPLAGMAVLHREPHLGPFLDLFDEDRHRRLFLERQVLRRHDHGTLQIEGEQRRAQAQQKRTARKNAFACMGLLYQKRRRCESPSKG